MGIVVPSPCMHAALLGPCFKTGPSPSPTPGGLAEASARPCGSGCGPGDLLVKGGTPAHSRHVRASSSARPAPGWGPRNDPAHCQTHNAELRRAQLRSPPAGPNADRARITRQGQGDRDARHCCSGAPRSTPGVPPARYSEPAAELRGRLHWARLDALLALITECFSEFPHGTYLLSGSRFEI